MRVRVEAVKGVTQTRYERKNEFRLQVALLEESGGQRIVDQLRHQGSLECFDCSHDSCPARRLGFSRGGLMIAPAAAGCKPMLAGVTPTLCRQFAQLGGVYLVQILAHVRLLAFQRVVHLHG